MNGPRGNAFRLIPSTFAAYAEPGFDTDIDDPESNLRAAIRYMNTQYGEAADLPTFDSDNLWGCPPFAWRLTAAALAVGVAAGWLLRGVR